MTSPADLLGLIDDQDCLDTLAAMARHKSYSQTEGEKVLVTEMGRRMAELGMESELTPVPGERLNAVGRWRGVGGVKLGR